MKRLRACVLRVAGLFAKNQRDREFAAPFLGAADGLRVGFLKGSGLLLAILVSLTVSQRTCGQTAGESVAKSSRVSTSRTSLNTVTLTTRQSEIPAAEAPPDATRLLADVQKNQKAIDQILESYTYTKVEEELALDNKGQTRSKRAREYEVFYVNDREVQKLVARDLVSRGTRVWPFFAV